MKKLLLLSLTVSIIAVSCTKDECTTRYSYETYLPIYKTMAEINEEIKFVPQRVLDKPGKIYYYDRYILINEREKGVHIIDNSDLRNPIKKGFIEIPGNVDISMTGQYIYADMSFNIVVIDISNFQNPRVVHVISDIKESWWPKDPEGRFMTALEYGETVEDHPCDQGRHGPIFYKDGLFMVDRLAMGNVSSPPSSTLSRVPEFNSGGQAGSLSRMALFDEHFYYVNDQSMHIFNVSKADNPTKLNEVYISWGMETIFPYEDKLFLGANEGMFIYDNRDKANPIYLSTFAHARACDPVVVEGNTAYVTLRDGNECQTFTNQLDIVDVSDLRNPTLIKSYPMHRPTGLAVRKNILYLCDDDQGLKVFDVADPLTVDRNLLGTIKDYHAYDVISLSDRLLLMIGADGFYQFDTKDPGKPVLLSAIKIGQ